MTLYYTFKTNRHIDQLAEKLKPLFVFGSLKSDLKQLAELIATQRPAQIIGIAIIKGGSRWETKAVNVFNSTKKVSSSGKAGYDLKVPTGTTLGISNRTTTTFCNWTMYKISQLIDQNNYKTSLSFVHLNPNDIQKALEYLTKS